MLQFTGIILSSSPSCEGFRGLINSCMILFCLLPVIIFHLTISLEITCEVRMVKQVIQLKLLGFILILKQCFVVSDLDLLYNYVLLFHWSFGRGVVLLTTSFDTRFACKDPPWVEMLGHDPCLWRYQRAYPKQSWYNRAGKNGLKQHSVVSTMMQIPLLIFERFLFVFSALSEIGPMIRMHCRDLRVQITTINPDHWACLWWSIEWIGGNSIVLATSDGVPGSTMLKGPK